MVNRGINVKRAWPNENLSQIQPVVDRGRYFSGGLKVKISNIGICSFLLLFVPACTDFSGRIAPYFSMEQVVDNVQCELQSAYMSYLPNYSWLQYWASSFAITLKREDKGGVTPKFDYLNPDVFGIGATGELAANGIRTLSTKRTLLLRDLPKYKCPQSSSSLVLTGSLGLYESMGEALTARSSDDVIYVEPDDLGYRIDFLVRAGIGASPTWMLFRVPGIGASLGASRETTHILDIAFADARPRPPQEVEVVNFPQAGVTTKGQPTIQLQGRPRSQQVPAPGRVPLDVRQRLDFTLQRLQLETLLPRR